MELKPLLEIDPQCKRHFYWRYLTVSYFTLSLCLALCLALFPALAFAISLSLSQSLSPLQAILLPPTSNNLPLSPHPQLLMQSHNPGVEFEYTVPKENATDTRKPEFTWDFTGWSHCTVSCGKGEASVVTSLHHVICQIWAQIESTFKSFYIKLFFYFNFHTIYFFKFRQQQYTYKDPNTN